MSNQPCRHCGMVFGEFGAPAPVTVPSEIPFNESLAIPDDNPMSLEQAAAYAEGWNACLNKMLSAIPPALVEQAAGNLASWPTEIWLQHGVDEVPSFDANADMTWCQDGIDDIDVKYVRADLAAKSAPAMKERPE